MIAADEPRSAESWVGRLPSELRPIVGTVAAPLVKQGMLDEDRRKFLGLLPDIRFRAADPVPERALRARLHTVLVDGAAPDEHDALLIGLLVPLELVSTAVGEEHRRAAKQRAKEIADQGVAGDAVHRAVQEEIMMAILPAIVVITATGSS